VIGSGPYVIKRVDAGRSVTLARNPAYWGRELAVNRGTWNFDTLRFDFYRDDNAAFEAFKSGQLDVTVETDPARWETAYGFPAVQDHRVVKSAFPSGLPKAMLTFIFTTPPPLFPPITCPQP